MYDYLITLVTAPSEEQAHQIASALVERRLAACVNLAPVTSIFRWEGRVQDEAEVLMIIKTRAQVFEDMLATIKALHSYELPEIIALPIVRGSNEYLKWIADETQD